MVSGSCVQHCLTQNNNFEHCGGMQGLLYAIIDVF